VLGQATGNIDTQDSPRPGLGGSHHLPPYSILCTAPRGLHPNGFSLLGLLSGNPEIVPAKNLATLEPHNFVSRPCIEVRSNQSCGSRRELSNGMSHVVCNLVNRVYSWLFLVGCQTDNLTPSPSFGHNLCFKCLNEQCEPILDIYILRDFQWYKERHKPLSFDPLNCSLKFWKSTGTPSPKVGVTLGVWGFTPSHFLTLPGVCDVIPELLFDPHPCNPFALIPGLPFGPQPCNPFALVVSPKLGLRH
jgi:hypothetical protein